MNINVLRKIIQWFKVRRIKKKAQYLSWEGVNNLLRDLGYTKGTVYGREYCKCLECGSKNLENKFGDFNYYSSFCLYCGACMEEDSDFGMYNYIINKLKLHKLCIKE